jgi:hypothetical protein
MATKTKRTAKAAPRKVNFDNEKGVLREVCRELDLDKDDCEIESISEGYRIECGRQSYMVMEDEDSFEKLAIERVTDDLRSEPELFNQSFIQNHINLEHLRDELLSDVTDMSREDLEREAIRNPLDFMEEHSIDVPEPPIEKVREWAETEEEEDNPEKTVPALIQRVRELDAKEQWEEIGEEPEVKGRDLDEIAETVAKERLSDPVGYLEDIYGKEDAIKEAIRIGGIDYDSAAQEAVSADGAAHFLCNYDGNYDTTSPSGFVVWREN